jgi:hypothetical protein
MFDKIKGLFTKSVPAPEQQENPEPESKPKQKRQSKPRVKTQPERQVSPKEKATLAGEPWVDILRVDVDPSNINSGSFELDWNDKFIINLIKAGYKQREDDTDQTIVDRWFQTVCRNIALEIYEQRTADPANRELDDIRRVQARDLGNGRTEIS